MKTKVLITAYAVNPYKGSEDGTGWNIIDKIASHCEVIAVTRRNNRQDIERFLAGRRQAEATPEFLYFDLPRWLSFWKKGERGALLYHYLWHLAVVFFVMRKKCRFDVAHHLNFHSDWTPSFLWLLGKPYVWGPVGHHEAIPAPFIREYGVKAWVTDRLKWWTKKVFWHFDPFLWITRHTAAKVIGVNASVRRVLKIPESRFELLPAIATEPPTMSPQDSPWLQVLSIGRFVPLKGFDITIRAFAHCYRQQEPHVQNRMRLVLIGKGPEKSRLENIVGQCGLPEGAIQFVPWLTRAELDHYFATSRLFMFPSHEGAGMVVPEALSYGVPVLCFNNFGPGALCSDLCAIRIPYPPSYEEAIERFSREMGRMLLDDALHAGLSARAREHYYEHFIWEKKAQRIVEMYHAAAPEKSTRHDETFIQTV